VICGECGDIYRRVHWNNRGKKSIVWRCVNRLEEKGSNCTSPTILEEDLQNAVIKAINRVIGDRDGFMATLQKNIETVLGEEYDKETGDIDASWMNYKTSFCVWPTQRPIMKRWRMKSTA